MRIEDPRGTMVAAAIDPRLLVQRSPDSLGPFYTVLPEGIIHVSAPYRPPTALISVQNRSIICSLHNGAVTLLMEQDWDSGEDILRAGQSRCDFVLIFE